MFEHHVLMVMVMLCASVDRVCGGWGRVVMPPHWDALVTGMRGSCIWKRCRGGSSPCCADIFGGVFLGLPFCDCSASLWLSWLAWIVSVL